MAIYISGSMAFDRIMTFQGHFKDSLVEDKMHMISISFMVDRMEEKFGGCAGNIAYSLALLGEAPLILSCAGRDFAPYAKWLESLGLPLDGIVQDDELFTALCYITTDLSNNQITGFYPGAMTLSCKYGFPHLNSAKDIGIVSPGNMTDMRSLAEYYRNNEVRYIYDPGQQLPVLEAADLLNGMVGAYVVTMNDYELEMVCKKTGKTEAEIQDMPTYCIITHGAKGAVVMGEGRREEVAVIDVDKVLDPTGAGDAHRAGLLKGLYAGLDVFEAATLGATAASFAIEQYGTQLHKYTKEEFLKRHTTKFSMPSKPLW